MKVPKTRFGEMDWWTLGTAMVMAAIGGFIGVTIGYHAYWGW